MGRSARMPWLLCLFLSTSVYPNLPSVFIGPLDTTPCLRKPDECMVYLLANPGVSLWSAHREMSLLCYFLFLQQCPTWLDCFTLSVCAMRGAASWTCLEQHTTYIYSCHLAFSGSILSKYCKHIRVLIWLCNSLQEFQVEFI